jgi:hypothetical protein
LADTVLERLNLTDSWSNANAVGASFALTNGVSEGIGIVRQETAMLASIVTTTMAMLEPLMKIAAGLHTASVGVAPIRSSVGFDAVLSPQELSGLDLQLAPTIPAPVSWKALHDIASSSERPYRMSPERVRATAAVVDAAALPKPLAEQNTVVAQAASLAVSGRSAPWNLASEASMVAQAPKAASAQNLATSTLSPVTPLSYATDWVAMLEPVSSSITTKDANAVAPTVRSAAVPNPSAPADRIWLASDPALQSIMIGARLPLAAAVGSQSPVFTLTSERSVSPIDIPGSDTTVRTRGINPAAAEIEAPTAAVATRQELPTAAEAQQGTIYLDGVRLGRWIIDHLARHASRPVAGIAGIDPRISASYPNAPTGT